MLKTLATGLLIGCLGILPLAGQAENDARPLPEPDEVIFRCIQALGGEEVLESIHSSISTGTFEGQGDVLPVEMGFEVPNKWYFTLNSSNGPVFQQASDGETAWTVNPGGLQEMPREQMLLTARLMDVQAALHFQDNYSRLEVVRRDIVDGRDAFVVEATSNEGWPETIYFDAKTGLVIRIDYTLNTEEGPVLTEVHYEDYRLVGATRIPFTIRQVGPEDWVISLKRARLNQTISDSKFERPLSPGV
jgi:outer membrane lipoprotein-sorting protein